MGRGRSFRPMQKCFIAPFMFKVVRHPQLQAYLAGNLVSIVGTWGQRVVLIWLAWDMTQSAAVLGTLAALDLAPSIIAAPLAGSLADRRPTRILARNLQLLCIIPPALLCALLWTGSVTIPALMLISLATGILNGLDHPIRLLLVGSVVPRPDVSSAVAINAMVFNVGRMIGPLLGGWAVSANWLSSIVMFNALSFALFAAVLSALRLQIEGEQANRAASYESGLAGWLAIGRAMAPFDRLLFLYFILIAFALRPMFELLPVFAADLAASGRDEASVFATLTATQGFGALIGAGFTALLLPRLSYRSFATVAGCGTVLTTAAFVAAGSYGVAVLALGALSGALLGNGIATQVMLQTTLPDGIRGRALSLYTMSFRGMPAFGTLLFGIAATSVSERLLFAGAAAVVALLSVVVVWRHLRR